MKFLFVSGPPSIRRIGNGKVRAERGETIDLTDAQYAHYAARGFTLEPADRRRKPPEVEEVPETETEDATAAE